MPASGGSTLRSAFHAAAHYYLPNGEWPDVSRSASAYERELKGILQGEAEALRGYARGRSERDRAVLGRLGRSPFLVVRAAGSLGFDLVALRNEFAFPLEVKASRTDTIRFSAASGRAAQQLEAHRKAVDRVGLVVLYAYRRLGLRGTEDPWRMFIAPAPPGRGRLDLLRRRLPEVAQTKDGNGVLRWNDGMGLVDFLDLVGFLTEPPEGA